MAIRLMSIKKEISFVARPSNGKTPVECVGAMYLEPFDFYVVFFGGCTPARCVLSVSCFLFCFSSSCKSGGGWQSPVLPHSDVNIRRKAVAWA